MRSSFSDMCAFESQVQFERPIQLFTSCKSASLKATGIVAITTLASAVDGTTMIPVFYVWPLLAACYLLTRTELAAVKIQFES